MAVFSLATMIVGAGVFSQEAVAVGRTVEELEELERLSSQTAHVAEDETVHTTANHLWLTADRGWVQAGDLKAGERVVTLRGISTAARPESHRRDRRSLGCAREAE
jgi:hypothetical protein